MLLRKLRWHLLGHGSLQDQDNTNIALKACAALLSELIMCTCPELVAFWMLKCTAEGTDMLSSDLGHLQQHTRMNSLWRQPALQKPLLACSAQRCSHV